MIAMATRELIAIITRCPEEIVIECM